MKNTHLIISFILLVPAAALLAGCQGKKQKADKPSAKPAPAQKAPQAEPQIRVVPPPGEQEPVAPAPDHQEPVPDEPSPQFPENIDEPYRPPDYEHEPAETGIPDIPPDTPGSISGKVFLGEPTDKNGNLYIYIPDFESVRKTEPRALASQIITADRITDSIVEFNLTGVPPGEHLILAVWDITEPHCDITQGVCPIASGRDRLGQSDLVDVLPGLKTKGVVVTMTSNELM